MHALSTRFRTSRPPGLRRALQPWAALACWAIASSAQAQLLIANVSANDSYRNYNTAQGLNASGGSHGGSLGVGGHDATSFASYAGGPVGYYAVSSAFARANLSTGSLHASTLTNGYYWGDARASAQLFESVTFHVAGANANTVTNIVIDLQLAGSISQERSANYLYNFSMSGQGGGVSVGWTTQFYSELNDPRNYVGWAVAGGAGEPSGFASWTLLANSATEKHFRGVLAFTGPTREFAIATTLGLGCSGGTNCDFGNSANLRFELPTGVSFTSASGELLSAVPEPGTTALMLAGAAALIGFARRRRS